MARAGDILFFLCLNDRGGAEISMLKLAQGLADRGRAVSLAVYGAQPQLARELGFQGEIIELGCARTWQALLPLYRLLRARRFSIVVSALTHGNIVGGIAARLAGRGVRTIMTEHGLDGLEACRVSPLFGMLTRFIYAHAGAIVAVSQTLAQKWRAVLPARARVSAIYNPIVGAEDHVPPPAHEWLREKTMPVVIGIGRLKEEKNFALLIEAFAQVAQKRAARLVILGEGPQREMLRELARRLGVEDRVLMPGFTADMKAWLAHADLLVLPSKREGFGNVLVEALACGVPVVATDCPYGPAEILRQGQYGRLVRIDDAVEMARAIIDSLDQKTDVKMLRDHADLFTVSRCIDLYGALMDTLPPA